ncbi:MAG: hypothetical protein WBB22_13385 [Anaerolineae bacterium]
MFLQPPLYIPHQPGFLFPVLVIADDRIPYVDQSDVIHITDTIDPGSSYAPASQKRT